MKFTLAEKSGQDDPGNKLDTDETAEALIKHNAVYHHLCDH